MVLSLVFTVFAVRGALMPPARSQMIWRSGRWIAMPYLALTIAISVWLGDVVAGLFAPLGLVGAMVSMGLLSHSPLFSLLALPSLILIPLAFKAFCLLSIRVGAWFRTLHDSQSPAVALAFAALILAADTTSAVYLYQRGQVVGAEQEAREAKRKADRAADEAAKATFLTAIPMQTFHGTVGGTPIRLPATPQVTIRFACEERPSPYDCYADPSKNPGDLLRSGPEALPPLRFTEIRVDAIDPECRGVGSYGCLPPDAQTAWCEKRSDQASTIWCTETPTRKVVFLIAPRSYSHRWSREDLQPAPLPPVGIDGEGNPVHYLCDHRFEGSGDWCGLAQPVAPGVVAWLKLPKYRDGSLFHRAQGWSAHITRLWAEMTATEP